MNTAINSEEADKEKKALINALNSSGTILEIQVYSILQDRWQQQSQTLPFLLQQPPPRLQYVGIHDDERKEIDCLARDDQCWYILEAKSSIYDWYFIEIEEPELRRANKPRLLLPRVNNDEKVEMERFTSFYHLTTNMSIEVKRNKEGKMSIAQATKGNKIYPEGEYYVERSDRGQIIQEACIQVISNMPWIIDELSRENKLSKFDRFVPVIVTNAKLFKITVSKKSLNARGLLEDISKVEPVDFLSYELDWPLKCSLAISGNLSFHQRAYLKETNLKSVIITTIDKLLPAMEAAKAH